jgi:hypothetical protein
MKHLALATLAVFTVAQVAYVPEAHAGRGSRALIGGLIGAAIGAAIYHHSRKGRSSKKRYRQPQAAVNSNVYPRTLGNWTIDFDRQNNICLASSISDNGTSYHIGMAANESGWFFSYTNQQWQSIDVGRSYDNIDYVFDQYRSFKGASTGIANGLLVQGLNEGFVEAFAASNKMSVHLDRRPIDQISLRGTRNATNAIKYCHNQALASLNRASVINALNKAPAPMPAPAVPAFSSVPATAPVTIPAPAPASDGIPANLGECMHTLVRSIGTRLQGEPDSGTFVGFMNGLSLVSYERVAEAEAAKPGDPVNVCLEFIPENCPPGDDRGRIYQVQNLRTMQSYSMPDSPHSCGGA